MSATTQERAGARACRMVVDHTVSRTHIPAGFRMPPRASCAAEGLV
jgi:hypothetical protein